MGVLFRAKVQRMTENRVFLVLKEKFLLSGSAPQREKNPERVFPLRRGAAKVRPSVIPEGRAVDSQLSSRRFDTSTFLA